MKSKAEGMGDLLKRITIEAVNEVMADELARGQTDNARYLRNARDHISNEVRMRVWRSYTMLEISDIMNWKKPKEV